MLQFIGNLGTGEIIALFLFALVIVPLCLIVWIVKRFTRNR